MSDQQYARNNRKVPDTFNQSYTSTKLSHPINSSNYYDASKHYNQNAINPLNQPADDYKTNSFLNNRPDTYLEQSSSILNNTYNQNGNYYDEFSNHQFEHRNSQNYSDYP